MLWARRGAAIVLDTISFDVEAFASDASTRRFRWRLKAPGQPDQASTESFATRREAVQAGEIALQRAIQRGRITR